MLKYTPVLGALTAALLTALPAHAVGGLVDVNVIDRDSGYAVMRLKPSVIGWDG